ncbi:hypothetical protein HSBAA_20060 [Vreelandella sulfidaeris]|uniref:Uncharacterized protein n=1 Tax=Vreelandella sulfidaeris TaxID=115553 RepID=A0A455U3P8_9GAMM|nr:hypothetical protein HSBAA_20060 [Halomonas sulfidaeris]
MGDAYPAASRVIWLCIAIPGELDLDPAVFVAVNLFAVGADHKGDLRAIDAGFRGGRRPPGHRRESA